MLEKSKGDIVGYFDADMILSPNLLLSSKLTFENNAKKYSSYSYTRNCFRE